jgi:hypothetical protein
MKSLLILALFLFLSSISLANGPIIPSQKLSANNPHTEVAQQGCCYRHEGVCGCSFGRITCCDGTTSPSCMCEKDNPKDLLSFDKDTCSEDFDLAQGYHYVQPYTRHDGTFVQGHYQTNPNSTTLDNWSTQGNVNPFTGEKGYRDPYYNSPNMMNTNTNIRSNSIYDYGHSNDD